MDEFKVLIDGFWSDAGWTVIGGEGEESAVSASSSGETSGALVGVESSAEGSESKKWVDVVESKMRAGFVDCWSRASSASSSRSEPDEYG